LYAFQHLPLSKFLHGFETGEGAHSDAGLSAEIGSWGGQNAIQSTVPGQ
tara:strand:+ start:3568 stop:3714 length:147 start_codon:yes stop_codon:yes gene_type:complete